MNLSRLIELRTLLFAVLVSGAMNAFGQNFTPTAGSTTTIMYPSGGYSSISDPGGPGGDGSCGIVGAPANNYPNCGCATVVTVCPDVAGIPIIVDFTEFGVNAAFDYVIVYDNNTTSGTVFYDNGTTGSPQYGEVCLSPGQLTATNPTGCLTIEFYASGVVDDPGFLAEIGVPLPNNVGVASISPTSPVSPTLQNLDVTVRNFGNNVVDSFMIDWAVNGVPQTGLSYNTSLAIGATTSPITIGTFTPASGDVVEVWTSLPNGLPDAFAANDTLSESYCVGLSGNYTINSGVATGGTNYASFADVIADLDNCGIGGPVVFDVVPGSGPYFETPHLGEVLGNSSVNTITFNGNGETISGSPSSTDEGIFTLQGADYVTIDSFVLVTTSTSYGIGVVITNSSNYNTIQNCTMDMTAITTNSSVAGAGLAITDDPGDPYDVGGASGIGNIIQNNTIKGGYYGIVVGGDAAGGSDSNQVLNNVIEDFYGWGILIEDVAETVIKGNDISRPTRSSVTTFYGIEIEDNTFNTLVDGNRIHNSHGGASSLTGTAYGIYIYDADAEAARPNVFTNNLIYDMNSNGTVYAIYNYSSDYTLIYHNTISLDHVAATGGVTRGFYQSAAAVGIEFYNNIVSITRGGSGLKYALYFGTSTSVILSDRNDLFVNSAGSGTQGVGYSSAGQTTLADWQTATGQDLTSFDVNPQFSNIAAFDFEPGSGTLNNVAITGLGVTEDFFGAARNLSSPDLGAIEFAGPLNDVGVFSIDNPLAITTPTAQNLDISINNYGRNAVDSMMITWSLNGIVQNTLNYQTLLAVAGTNTLTVDTYTPAAGDIVQVWTSMPNGVADNGPVNDTATMSFCLGMSGNFTIDQTQPASTSNFISFQAAIDSMASCGIDGPVVFDVVAGSGPYLEDPTVPFINGASSTNTITFQAHGDTLAYTPGSADEGIFTLDGAQWVTIDSLGIGSLSSSYGIGVIFINNADNNTISNCTIDMRLVTGSTTTAGAGIAFTDDDGDPYDAGGTTGSNNTIEDNTILGGYYGIVVAGSSTLGGCENNQILNNTIADFESYGILVEDAVGTQIIGNDISRGGRTDVTTFYGIELDDNTFNTLIDKNKIHNTHGSASSLTGSSYGLYFDGADADAARPNIVTNNLVYDFNSNGTIYAIYNYSSDYNLIVNNTVSLDDQNSTGGTTRGFYQYLTADSVVFANNVITLRRAGTGTKHAIYLSTTTSNVTSDYNNLFVPSAGSGTEYFGYYSSTSYDALSTWQTANTNAYDQNSLAVNPRYTDLSTGNLEPTSAAMNDQGFFVGLLDDHYGNVRSTTTPDMGAIEYTPAPDDAGAIAFVSPVMPLSPGLTDVEVAFRNFGSLDLTDVDLYLTIDDGSTVSSFGPVSYTGLVASAATDTLLLTSYNFTGGSYTLRAWTALPNGSVDQNTVNDTVEFSFCTALPAGTYSINSTLPTGGTNYQTFAEAADALQCGILGDVVFEVAYGTGPYLEQVTVYEVPGAGPTATVTFDGQDSDSTVLLHDGSIEYATFLLNGADYVTITNMTIVNTGVNYGFGVQLTDNANYNTVSNTVINVSTSFGTTADVNCITVSGSTTNSFTEGLTGSYNLFENNTLNGGEFGVHIEATSTLRGTGNRIIGNSINGQDDACIYTDEQDSLYVMNNVVRGLRTSTTVDGMYIYDVDAYFVITGNDVAVSDYAIYLNYANYVGGSGRALVANNFVYSEADYGIYLNYADSIDVFHNTVMGEPALRCNLCDYVDLRNNVFVSNSDYAFEDDDSDIDYVSIDYNIYHSNGSYLARFGGTGSANDHSDLASWQAANASFNVNSQEILPAFVSSPADLHMTGLIGNDVGDNTVGITVDIDGDTRPLAPSTTVDIGADEFAPLDNDIAVVGIVNPVNGSCGDSSAPVEIIIFNNGYLSQSSFDVSVDVTGATTANLVTTYSQTLASGQYDTVYVGGVNTVNGGSLVISATTNLTTDQYTVNDNMTFTANVDSLPEPPVAIGDTGCVNESLTVQIAPNTYGETYWYDAIGGSLINVGNTLTTPNLTNSATYYVQGINYSNDTTGMRIADAGTSTFLTQTSGWGVAFTVNNVVTIRSVSVIPVGTGTIVVSVYDLDNGNQLVQQSGTINISGPNANTLPLNFTLPPGNYQMGLATTGITNMVRSSSGVSVPYSNSDGSLVVTAGKTSFTATTTSSYYWFYDFVTEKQGCASELVPVHAVISRPASDAGGNDTICVGDSVTITAGNGTSWSWNTGETTQSITVGPLSTTTYTLTITDQYGCLGTPDAAEVLVSTLPTASAGADDTICVGSTVNLVASGGVGYEWSNSMLTSSISVSPTTTTDYSVTVTNAYGCVDADTVTISTNALPSGNAPADTAICLGEPAALTATGGASYVWSTGASVPTVTVSPSSTTTYNVTTTDANGCVGLDSVVVTVNQPVALSITAPDTVCVDDDAITLVGDPVGGTFSGVGVTAGEFVPANVGLGTYTVRYRYTDGLGCESTTQTDIVVTQSNCLTSITDVNFIETLNVFPNPFSTDIAIELNSVESGVLEIRMLNLLGQELLTQKVELTTGSNSYTVKPSTDLADGFYFIELRKGEQKHLIKMLKAH